jgi:hypothetical protein
MCGQFCLFHAPLNWLRIAAVTPCETDKKLISSLRNRPLTLLCLLAGTSRLLRCQWRRGRGRQEEMHSSSRGLHRVPSPHQGGTLGTMDSRYTPVLLSIPLQSFHCNFYCLRRLCFICLTVPRLSGQRKSKRHTAKPRRALPEKTNPRQKNSEIWAYWARKKTQERFWAHEALGITTRVVCWRRCFFHRSTAWPTLYRMISQ